LQATTPNHFFLSFIFFFVCIPADSQYRVPRRANHSHPRSDQEQSSHAGAQSHLLAILLAAIASMLTGLLWYAPLLSRQSLDALDSHRHPE
jgi:hypothetical protein